MAIAFVQSKATIGSATTTLSAGTGAGNTVVYAVYAYSVSAAAISAASPTVGGTAYPSAVQVLSGLSPGTDNVLYSVWLFPNVPSGATAFAVTVTGGTLDTNDGSGAWEFSGLGAAPAADRTVTGSGTSGTVASGTTPAIRFAPELVFGAAIEFAVAVTPPGSPWTGSLQPGSNNFAAGSYQIATSSGGTYSYSPAGTGNDWAAGVVTIAASQTALNGSAALSGTGSLTASPAVAFACAAALSGSGSLASAGLVTQPAAAALSGSGSLASSAAVQFLSGAVLSGSGALTATALAVQPAAASLSGSGALGAAALAQFAVSAALSGTGTLAAAALAVQPASAALTGTGSLTAAGLVSGLVQGSASLSGSGALAVAAAVALRQGAALSGTGALAAAVLVAVPGAASLSGSGLLLAAVAVTFPASASLSGTGSVTASASAGSPTSAALSGTGSLAAGAVLAARAAASLSGSGVIAVFAQVTAPVTEPPVLWSASPAPPRWRAAPCQPRWAASPSALRWRLLMALFPPIAAVSLEEVNVTWESGLAGTFVDPTGQTDGQPALPVQFAFPQSSGNYAAPAQPSVWLTGSWLLGGTSIGYTAQCLVGPGGTVTLTAGLGYDCWTRVSGSPESPVKFAGTIEVY